MIETFSEPTATARPLASRVTPAVIKTLGYLVSTVSVILLGVASWSGAARAGLTAVLILGMITSIVGMGFRWYSYQLDKQKQDQ
jgi:hypothetical protein